jgi:hypothetical protein
MRAFEVRNWLGIYFLVVTSVLGAYILLFGETRLLPITQQDSSDAFEIIIPVLVGQLIIIFRWYAGATDLNKNDVIALPRWVVIGPPLIVLGILVVTIGVLIVTNLGDGSNAVLSASRFKGIVTFCVTLLNATTIFIIIRYFEAEKNAVRATSGSIPASSSIGQPPSPVSGVSNNPTDA